MSEVFSKFIQEHRLSELAFFMEKWKFSGQDKIWFDNQKSEILEKIIAEYQKYTNTDLLLRSIDFYYDETKNMLATCQIVKRVLVINIHNQNLSDFLFDLLGRYKWISDSIPDVINECFTTIIKQLKFRYKTARERKPLLYVEKIGEIHHRISQLKDNQEALNRFSEMCSETVDFWINSFEYVVDPHSHPEYIEMTNKLQELIGTGLKPNPTVQLSENNQSTPLPDEFKEFRENLDAELGMDVPLNERELNLYDSIIEVLEYTVKPTDETLIDYKFRYVEALAKENYFEVSRSVLSDLIVSILPHMSSESTKIIFQKAMTKVNVFLQDDEPEYQTLQVFLEHYVTVGFRQNKQKVIDEIIGYNSSL